jgi:hypothetical protein
MNRFLIVGATVVFASAMAIAQSTGSSSGSTTDQQTSGANGATSGSYNQNANTGYTSSQQRVNLRSTTQTQNATHVGWAATDLARTPAVRSAILRACPAKR